MIKTARPPLSNLFLLATFLVVLGGCTLKPTPLTSEKRGEQVFVDLAQQFSRQKPPQAPITLHHAMARAIHFNIGHRVKIMNQVLARGMVRVASRSLLPALATNAGYTSQNRATSDGQLANTTGDLSVSWNVLDLGVSYLSAIQQTDRLLIAEEIQRKAAHTLLTEVRSAYWRLVAAERLESALKPLKIKINSAIESARQAEEARIEEPAKALKEQVALLETWQKLQKLQKELSSARIQLAELMGLDPGFAFTLAAPPERNPIDLNRLPPMETLEGYALLHRPELWQGDYKRRIRAYDTKKAILRLFPGLDFSQSLQYDNTETYANNIWSEFGINLTWNIINLLSAPDTIALSRDKERMEDLTRLALNMSVLGQVHIANRNVKASQEGFLIASRLSDAKERLYRHAQAEKAAETTNEIDLISREGDRILYLAQRDMAFAKLQNAAGDFLVSLGLDILPTKMEGLDFDTLQIHIQNRNSLIASGRLPDLTPTTPSHPQPDADDPEMDSPIWEMEKKPKSPLTDPELDTPEWEIHKQESFLNHLKTVPQAKPKPTNRNWQAVYEPFLAALLNEPMATTEEEAVPHLKLDRKPLLEPLKVSMEILPLISPIN